MGNDHHFMLEHSVIRIIGKDGKTTCGTGFLVAENIAVTCAHLIGIAGAKPGTPVQFKFDDSDELQWATVDEAHFSPGSVDDIAFIILNDIPDHVKPMPLASARKSDGHSYKSYGYPTEAEPVKARKPAASINGVVPASEPGVQPLLEVKGEEWGHGLSGAPIFDLSYQAVIGMVTQGKRLDTTKLGYATTADTICLHHPNIPLDKAPLPGLPPFPPQNILPDPAPLPQGSRMPFIRNDLFTGRVEDLKNLAAELLYSTNGRTVALTQPVAAAGMGGIGKTQLAVEFCYRYGQFCEGVHWINAANPDALGSEIADCGLRMGIKPWSEKQSENIETTLREWAKSRRRIVVLDNLEDPSMLGEWLPKLQNVHVLATTRRVEWPPELGMQVQRLEHFPREESLRLLRKLCHRLEKETDETLAELSDLLCDLPLAVDLAGRYLKQRKSFSPQQYIQSLKLNGVLSDYAMNDEGANEATRHLKSLEATFEMSWKELYASEGSKRAKEMSLARLAFLCAGYCAPGINIPTVLIEIALKMAHDHEGTNPIFDAVLARGIAHLNCLGLLESTEEEITIHPLISEFAIIKDGSLTADKEAFPILLKMFIWAAIEVDETGLPEFFKPIQPHLEAVVNHCEKRGSKELGLLLGLLGSYHNLVADFKSAKSYFERALLWNDQVYGSESHRVASDLGNLSLVYQQLGELQEAKKFCERSLVIIEKLYEPDDQHIASGLNNLGLIFIDLGDFPSAKKCFERALEIDEKQIENDALSLAIHSHNFGGVLQELGDYQQAMVLYERALDVYEKEQITNHPRLSNLLNGIATICMEQRDNQKAKELIERALEIDENLYGSDHPNVGRDLNNLGYIFQELGDLSKAKDLFERALEICEAAYGLKHPKVAIVLNSLGGVMADLGNLTAAKDYYERALAIDLSVLGREHPVLAVRYNNLSTIHMDLGNIREAREFIDRALRIDEDLFGKENINYADHLYTKGLILLLEDDLKNAKECFFRALKIYTTVLPENHPKIFKGFKFWQLAEKALEVKD